MAVELSDPSILTALITEIGRIGLYVQALGLIIVIWLLFQIISAINNRIKRRKLYSMEERLKKIENKINKLLKKNS